MSKPDHKDFIEQYAEVAMKHQVLYGIPASITLAQLCLETGYGKSSLFLNSNNGFGIKAGDAWLKENRPYFTAKDDHPDDKFRVYQSVETSIEDHSKLLKSSRYSSCYQNGVTDYAHFARELQRNGYATDPQYANKLMSVIQQHHLDRYDQQALTYDPSRSVSTSIQLAYIEGHWSMPLTPSAGGLLEVDPQKGTLKDELFLKSNYTSVFSTEDHGKVVNVGYAPEKGKFVSVSYPRGDQGSYEVTFTHLDQVNVKKGDTVNAQTPLGISGETGQCSGPALGLLVTQTKDGESKAVSPISYLAELSLRGNLSVPIMEGNKDLLAEARKGYQMEDADLLAGQDVKVDQACDLSSLIGSNDPTAWLKYLAEAKKDGPLLGGQDIIADLVGLMFSGILSMSSLFNTPDKEKEIESVPEALLSDAHTPQHIVIQRQREGFNAEKATQLCSLNFDAMSAEEQHTVVQRLN